MKNFYKMFPLLDKLLATHLYTKRTSYLMHLNLSQHKKAYMAALTTHASNHNLHLTFAARIVEEAFILLFIPLESIHIHNSIEEFTLLL